MIRLIIIILNTFDFISGIFVKTIFFSAGMILELASTIFRGIDSLFDLFFFTMSLLGQVLGKGISLLGNVIYFLGNGIYTLANSFYTLTTAYLYTLLAGIALVGRCISYVIRLIPLPFTINAVSIIFVWCVAVGIITYVLHIPFAKLPPIEAAYSEVAFYEAKIDAIFDIYRFVGNHFLRSTDPFYDYLGYKTETEMWRDFYWKELGIHKTAWEVDNPRFDIQYFKDQADFINFLAKQEGLHKFLESNPDLQEGFETLRTLADQLKKACISAEKAVDKYLDYRLPRAEKLIEQRKATEAFWGKIIIGGTLLLGAICVGATILEACNNF